MIADELRYMKRRGYSSGTGSVSPFVIRPYDIRRYACTRFSFYKNTWFQFQPAISYFFIYSQPWVFLILILTFVFEFPEHSSVKTQHLLDKVNKLLFTLNIGRCTCCIGYSTAVQHFILFCSVVHGYFRLLMIFYFLSFLTLSLPCFLSCS